MPSSLGACTKLKQLALEENQLEGAIPEELGRCVELQGLYLNANKLSGAVPSSLGACTKLEQLWLEENQGIETPTPHICPTRNCVHGLPWKVLRGRLVPPSDAEYGVSPWDDDDDDEEEDDEV